MSLKLRRLALLVLILFTIPSTAFAHTGVGAAFGFFSGLLHPLSGLDHLLAMFAVGLLAAQLGGRAIWLVPAAFVAMMIAGAIVGFAGYEIPGVEFGILTSIVAIALPVAFALGMPAPFAMAYVGFFALFHGYAHGAELPTEAEALPYIGGFALATAIIHALGVGAGLACSRFAAIRQGYALRTIGGLIVLAGVGLAVA